MKNETSKGYSHEGRHEKSGSTGGCEAPPVAQAAVAGAARVSGGATPGPNPAPRPQMAKPQVSGSSG